MNKTKITKRYDVIAAKWVVDTTGVKHKEHLYRDIYKPSGVTLEDLYDAIIENNDVDIHFEMVDELDMWVLCFGKGAFGDYVEYQINDLLGGEETLITMIKDIHTKCERLRGLVKGLDGCE